MGRGRPLKKGRRRTVPDATQVGQYAIGPTAARRSEGRAGGIVACKVEEVLELGWAEVERGESVVALGQRQGRVGDTKKTRHTTKYR